MATRKRRAENATSEDTQDGPNNNDFTPSSVPLDAEEHLLQIPDSHRALISLTGKGFERALLSKLDWMTYLYVQSSPHCNALHGIPPTHSPTSPRLCHLNTHNYPDTTY